MISKCYQQLSHDILVLLITTPWLEIVKLYYADIKYSQFVLLVIITYLNFNINEICDINIRYHFT